jgi:hypothetical protein
MLVSDPAGRMTSAELWSLIDGLKYGEEEETKEPIAKDKQLLEGLPRTQDTQDYAQMVAHYCSASDKASNERVFRHLVATIITQQSGCVTINELLKTILA